MFIAYRSGSRASGQGLIDKGPPSGKSGRAIRAATSSCVRAAPICARSAESGDSPALAIAATSR